MNTPATPAKQWAVQVTLPTGHLDAPPDIDPVRRIGPYDHRTAAQHIAAALSLQLTGSAPAGTTVDVVNYDPARPHIDPDVPRDVTGLAMAISAEPDRPGGGWGFPDLYDILSATVGSDTAGKLWSDACSYLDTLAEGAEVERQRDEHLALFRALVRRAAARWRASLVTEPVVEEAGELLADLWDMLEARGVLATDLEVDLADAMLDGVTAKLRRSRPDTAEKAAPLLTAFAARMTELGQPTTHDPGLIDVDLPHLPTTPVRYPLVVSLSYSGGWDMFARTGGRSPVVMICAPFTVDGARAVADLAAAVNRGELGNPLLR